ncbi:hypothetical protein [Halomonas icarae]|uniref:Uncharacterized protein n=1 Tax=Halomonas icarae TaxID=2691040 RepID=A0A7X4VWQ5_9GAMM|nr:hypothetical protein [Halomonas icarae]MDR5903035.1 hypothetical protein [Halomonas icarae]NAW11591.1 hypothetical protein [Halomonas icarae]
MQRTHVLGLTLALLLILWLAALPAAASSLQIEIAQRDLTPQPRVLALKPASAANVFAAVEAIEPDGRALLADRFTLIFPRRPKALEALREGWRLVAATNYRHPSTPHPALPLYRHGLMARVVTIASQEGRWSLELEHVELKEIIESGSLSITAAAHFASSDEGFADERLFPEGRFYPEWRWLDASFATDTQDPECLPGDLTADLHTTFALTAIAEVEARYVGTLALEHSWEFQGGALKSAQLESYVCQASQLQLTIGDNIEEVVPLWHRSYGPTFHMVGWLPLMLEVKGKLGFRLMTSGELALGDPLISLHEATGILTLKDDNWDWASPPSQSGMEFSYPRLRMDSKVEASLGLLPRLELILYSMTGPYMQAESSRTINWQPPAPPEASRSFSLMGGITHRTSRWGSWSDKQFVTWPIAQEDGE